VSCSSLSKLQGASGPLAVRTRGLYGPIAARCTESASGHLDTRGSNAHPPVLTHRISSLAFEIHLLGAVYGPPFQPASVVADWLEAAARIARLAIPSLSLGADSRPDASLSLVAPHSNIA